MRRLTVGLVALLVGCSSPITEPALPEPTTTTWPTAEPTTNSIADTTTPAEVLSTAADTRTEFFAALPESPYLEGMVEDDVWMLVEGVCHAMNTGLSGEQVVQRILEETDGIVDLTVLVRTIAETGCST